MRSLWLLTPAVLAASTSGFATTYLTVAEAQAALFPGGTLTPRPIALSPDQLVAIRRTSGTRQPTPTLDAWKVRGGGWFLVDNVIGKHDYITYAVGIDGRGCIRGVEILEYRESYGGEVRAKAWRHQFLGKTADAPLELGKDIRSISGATLSSRHVTEGVKRLMAAYELVLRNLD